jgi:hypothetical protein
VKRGHRFGEGCPGVKGDGVLSLVAAIDRSGGPRPRLNGNPLQAGRMMAALNYVCGKCLARLEGDKRRADGASRQPDCGRDPVLMLQPVPRHLRRQEPQAEDCPAALRRAGPKGRCSLRGGWALLLLQWNRF